MRSTLHSPAPSSLRWPLPALLTLSAAVFLSVTTEMLPTGVLPMMSRDLSVPPSRLGFLITAYALMVALFAAPLGALTARLPRRRLLLATLGGYTICNLVTALGTGYAVTLVSRLGGGLTHAVFWAMLGGYVSRMVPGERVGRAVTIVFTGGTGAILAGVPAGTALGHAVGWRAAFALLSAAAIGLAGLGLWLLPELPGAAPDQATGLLRLLSGRALALVVSMTVLIMLGHFSFYSYVAPYLLHAGLPEGSLSLVLLGNGAAGAAGLVITGLVVDRHPRSAMLVAALLLSSALLVLAVIGGGDLPAVVTCVIAIGLALGALPILLQAATLRAAPHAPEHASALNASAFNIGIGGGALCGGLLLEHAGAAALPLFAVTLTGLGLIPVVASARLAPSTG